MNNKYIGIFDSGIGGLTVVKSIIETMENENIVYFGDTKNTPYGDKTATQIQSLVKNDVDFLKTFDLKAIVIACNTADSIARKEVIKTTNIPVYGVVEPASKKAVELTKNNKIGVIATKATVDSKAYIDAIHSFNPDTTICTQACPELVPLIEQGRFNEDDIETIDILKEYLNPLMYAEVDTLILGCTHYPLVKHLIQMIMPNVSIISSSDCAAEYVKKELSALDLLNDHNPVHKFYVSSEKERFTKVGKLFMNLDENSVYEIED